MSGLISEENSAPEFRTTALPEAVESLRRALSYLKRANLAGNAGPIDADLLSFPYACGAAEVAIETALAMIGVRS